jgi:hypothetical protein
VSAWAEVVNHDGSDEWLELCNRALQEVQRETSRRNAEKIRTASPEHYMCDSGFGDTACTYAEVADLIDPEVTS